MACSPWGRKELDTTERLSLHFTPSGIFVPQPGIEPRTVAVKVLSPNHWIAGEFPANFFFLKLHGFTLS